MNGIERNRRLDLRTSDSVFEVLFLIFFVTVFGARNEIYNSELQFVRERERGAGSQTQKALKKLVTQRKCKKSMASMSIKLQNDTPNFWKFYYNIV